MSRPSPRQETMPMPVIQVWPASGMCWRLARECDRLRDLLHAGAELRRGELDQPEGDLGIAHELAPDLDLRLGHGVTRALVQERGAERQRLAGRHERPQLRLLERGKERH